MTKYFPNIVNKFELSLREMENMNDENFLKNCNLVAKFIRVRNHINPNHISGGLDESAFLNLIRTK